MRRMTVMELYSRVFLDLYRRNRRSPELYNSFGFWHPIRRLRRYTVIRAWIGIWSPTTARLISRLLEWRQGLTKVSCDSCGTEIRSRDTRLSRIEDAALVCFECCVFEIGGLALKQHRQTTGGSDG